MASITTFMHANCPTPWCYFFITPNNIFYNIQQACLNQLCTGIEELPKARKLSYFQSVNKYVQLQGIILRYKLSLL